MPKEITNKKNVPTTFQEIKIFDIKFIDDYLFLTFENGQKILINEKQNKIYDLSEYTQLADIFPMKDRICAGLTKGFTIYLIDLDTKEVLFDDEDAMHISKQDDRTIHVIKKLYKGNNTIYDIETKKYLPIPEDYEFEHSLGNGLYVFSKKDYDEDFYKLNRCVLNAQGETLLSDVNGWIYLCGNHLAISKKSEIDIVEMKEDNTFDIKTIKKDDTIIADPEFYKNQIVIIEKNCVKLYTPSLKLLKEYNIDGIEEVLDYEIVGQTLKLCLPYSENGNNINRHLFVNLVTGKTISHLRIEGYPYWNPTTFIGKDNINDDEIKEIYFYNKDFEIIYQDTAHDYVCADSKKETVFSLRTYIGSNNENGYHTKFINTQTGVVKNIDCDVMCFHSKYPYGYYADTARGVLNFIDEYFNVLISDFDYKKHDLKLGIDGFYYTIVNDYIIINKSFYDGYGQTRSKCILQKQNEEPIIDSLTHKCFVVGDYIKIEYEYNVEYLNTLTGEIGPIALQLPINESGKINIRQISNINCLLNAANSDNDILTKKLAPKSKKED